MGQVNVLLEVEAGGEGEAALAARSLRFILLVGAIGND
jgi:hypothetical protein